jgi:aspartyl-tRNA(Asn)/glutamyl-tRNA(Gln) amidotransferase subunit B
VTDYETIVGLECHVELSTRTKMFCGCPNEFGGEPNTRVCPICLGHPGTLPVPNREAVERTMKIALALGCEIVPRSLFHRKNYFYPDMPKNYQISQYDLPIGSGGHLDIEVDGEARRIGITRVHLEEDTGKTVHPGTTGRIAEAEYALEDYNRAGVPLVEVVSEPDMRSADEARSYLVELRALLESLDVSDVRMEEGSFRCDANVSVRPVGRPELGVKAEIKNMNSIRSVERAVRFEEERQGRAVEAGETLIQETRHWDEGRGVTLPLRSKEFAFDYRYFPEPDLNPVEADPAWIERLRSHLPELPWQKRQRFMDEDRYELRQDQAALLARSPEWSEVFELIAAKLPGVHPRMHANWVIQTLMPQVTAREALRQADAIVEVLRMVNDGAISPSRGNDVVTETVATGKPPAEIVEEKGWAQISDESALGALVDEVIAENPGPVEQFRGGKEGVIGFLVGQVMKKTGGAANPQEAQRLLRDRLSS